MSETLDTLRLIVSRSQAALTETLGAIKAEQSRSSTAARRAARAASIALEDPDATWTPEEREQIAGLLGRDIPNDELRNAVIQFRASKAEKRQVAAAAKAAGLTQSDYIRRRLDLPTLDENSEKHL